MNKTVGKKDTKTGVHTQPSMSTHTTEQQEEIGTCSAWKRRSGAKAPAVSDFCKNFRKPSNSKQHSTMSEEPRKLSPRAHTKEDFDTMECKITPITVFFNEFTFSIL